MYKSLGPPRPAPQTDLMISKYIMDQLVDEYGYSEEGRLRQNMNSDDLLSLSNFFWVVHTAAYPLERDLLQLWCMILFCASTTARAGTVVESSCYYGHNDAVQYRDIRLYAMPDPDSPSQGVNLGMSGSVSSRVGETEAIRKFTQAEGTVFVICNVRKVCTE